MEKKKRRPAASKWEQEQIIAGLAMDLIEQRIRDGTASNQLLAQIHKDNTLKAELERQKLEEENKLLKAKTEALEREKEMSVDLKEVMDALRKYSGQSDADMPI